MSRNEGKGYKESKAHEAMSHGTKAKKKKRPKKDSPKR